MSIIMILYNYYNQYYYQKAMASLKYAHPTVSALQTRAYTHYTNREYAECLQLYTECLKQPSLTEIAQLQIQTIMCIVNMHLHNYTQAHQQLVELEYRLSGLRHLPKNNKTKQGLKNNRSAVASSSVNTNQNASYSSQLHLQYKIIQIKVQVCLMQIELLNCNREQVEKHLDNIISIMDNADVDTDENINSNQNTDKISNKKVEQHQQAAICQSNNRNILCSSLLLILFRAGSFHELSQRVQQILSQKDEKFNSQRNVQSETNHLFHLQISPLLLTSLSITISLTSSPQLAYKLQFYCHQLLTSASQLQIIPTLISCKHLITLTEELGYSTACQAYKKQFKRLMNTPEIYGISEQTLFRGYQQKIQIGKQIVGKLMQYERKAGFFDNSDRWLLKKVVHKLQQFLYRIENDSSGLQIPKQALVNTLNALNSQNGLQILLYMKSSHLVQTTIKEEIAKFTQLGRVLRRISYLRGWNNLMLLPPRAEQEQAGQVLSQNKINYNNNPKNQLGKQLKVQNNMQNYGYKDEKKVKTSIQNDANTYARINANGFDGSPISKDYRLAQRNQQSEMNKYYNQDNNNGNPNNNRRYKQVKYQQEYESRLYNQLDQSQRYEQFRSRQDRLEREAERERSKSKPRTNQSPNAVRNFKQNEYIQNKEQLYRRENNGDKKFSNENAGHRNYVSTAENNFEVKRNQKRKFQHTSVINKSPARYNNRSPSHSPYGEDNLSQSQREKIKIVVNDRLQKDRQIQLQQQTNAEKNVERNKISYGYKINGQIGKSKIANSKNNVYLDSDSSRFVNPLEEYQDYDGYDISNNKIYTNQYVNANRGVSNLTNIESKAGKPGLNSKIQRRQPVPQNQQNRNRNQISNFSTLPNNLEQVLNENSIPHQQNIVSILKSQNSRIKNTQKEITNLNASRKKQPENLATINQGPAEIGFSGNLKMNSNYNKSYSNINKRQNTNIPSSARVISNQHIMNQTINRNEQIGFNNVDILIQPASNPNNVSNLTSYRGVEEAHNPFSGGKELTLQKKQEMMQKQSQMNLTKIGYNSKEVDRGPTFGQQTSNSHSLPNSKLPNSKQAIDSGQNLIKKTDSNILINHKSKLEKLTPKSPYIKKLVKLCEQGQYFIKRHFSSDGGEQKFVQLNGNIIKWAVDEDKISSKYQSYKLKDIKGVAYGKVTETFLKQCNKKLLPWQCFSLILPKRTLDFYCIDEIQPVIWLPGITAALAGQTLNLRYPKKKGKQKGKDREERDEEVAVSLFTPGKVLWMRFLMKLQEKYIKPLKKNHKGHRGYKNINAHAIILWNQQFTKKSIM